MGCLRAAILKILVSCVLFSPNTKSENYPLEAGKIQIHNGRMIKKRGSPSFRF